jgi:hypothetical protein
MHSSRHEWDQWLRCFAEALTRRAKQAQDGIIGRMGCIEPLGLLGIDILKLHTASRTQAMPRLFDALQEARIMLQTVFEPIFHSIIAINGLSQVCARNVLLPGKHVPAKAAARLTTR